jgi:hypothetical protein
MHASKASSVFQVRLRRALLSDDWKIENDVIVLGWTRKDGPVVNRRHNTVGSAVSLNLSTVNNIE